MEKIIVASVIYMSCVAWHFDKRGVLVYKDTLTTRYDPSYTYSVIGEGDDTTEYYSYKELPSYVDISKTETQDLP